MNTVLQHMKTELHISASQIFTYLGCSLKYRFHYVEQRIPQHVSIGLPFGKAIHRSVERYYRFILDTGGPALLQDMLELFIDTIHVELNSSQAPILYKKETPDLESVIELGARLLETFHDSIDMTGMEVVATELPLCSPLYTENGERTDFNLVGVLDLVLRGKENGELLIVDNKTSRQKKSQETVDGDLQMSAYSYLLAANGMVFPRATVRCRFDVLQKLKTPRLDHYYTSRTAQARKRFAKIASAVLAGIENRIYIPARSWLCADCQYADACTNW